MTLAIVCQAVNGEFAFAKPLMRSTSLWPGYSVSKQPLLAQLLEHEEPGDRVARLGEGTPRASSGTGRGNTLGGLADPLKIKHGYSTVSATERSTSLAGGNCAAFFFSTLASVK